MTLSSSYSIPIPTSVTSIGALDPNRAAITAFIESRYEGQRGWACIGSIDGDPSIKEGKPGHTPLKQEFYRWPEQRPQLLDRLTWLAAHVGNIYAAPCLFRTQRRHRSTALPSPWLWMDDAPAGVTCTELVQTSAASCQAWKQLDQLASYDERRTLMRAWRDQHPGADTGSADPVHMARVPGGYNTKAHGHQLVTLARTGGAIVALEQLRAQVAELLRQRSPSAGQRPASDQVDWFTVDHWLGNIGTLLNPNNGLPRRMKNANGQARKLLETGPLANTSDTRYIIARGLAYHGYAPSVIAALLLYFCDYGASAAKGSAWLEEDIERVIAKVIADLGTEYRPSVERTQASTPAAPPAVRPQIAAPRMGRPRTGDATRYTYWLVDNQTGAGTVIGTRKENAAQLGISVPTLDRWEKTLRNAGVITRHTTKSRRDSWLVIDQAAADAFLSTIKSPLPHPDHVEIEVLSAGPIHPSPIADPSTNDLGRNTPPPLDPFPAVAAAVDESPSTADQGIQPGGCVPPIAPLQPVAFVRLSLVDLVRDAFDAAPGRRMTLAFVRRYVRLQHGGNRFDDSAIARVVDAERKRRAASTSIFAKARAEARAAGDSDLRRQAKSAASGYASAERRVRRLETQIGTASGIELVELQVALKRVGKTLGLRRALAAIWAEEEARRSDLVEVEQAYLVDLADAALAELRPVAPVASDAGRVAALVDVGHSQIAEQLDLLGSTGPSRARGLIQRLKVRQVPTA